jgi:hypothetical protein
LDLDVHGLLQLPSLTLLFEKEMVAGEIIYFAALKNAVIAIDKMNNDP